MSTSTIERKVEEGVVQWSSKGIVPFCFATATQVVMVLVCYVWLLVVILLRVSRAEGLLTAVTGRLILLAHLQVEAQIR